MSTAAVMDEVEAHLGLQFKRKNFLEQAILHPSYIKGKEKFFVINVNVQEKLTFLGGKLLDLAVSELIFRHVTTNPKVMNQFYQELISRQFINKLASGLGLERFILKETAFQWKTAKKSPFVYRMLAAIYFEHSYKNILDIVSPVFYDLLYDIKENRTYDYLAIIEDWSSENQWSLNIKDHGTEIRTADSKHFFIREIEVQNKRSKGKGETAEIAIKRASKEFVRRHLQEGQSKLPLKNFKPTPYAPPRYMLNQDRVERLKKIPFIKDTKVNLLHQCLLHKSYQKEVEEELGDYSTWTTLGSAVQSFMFAHFLFSNNKNLGVEKSYEHLHTKLCGAEMNSYLFDQFKLGELLWTGKIVKRIAPSIKDDCIKALFGAFFISKRERAVEPHHMLKLFLYQYIPEQAAEFKKEDFNPKTVLMETVQALGPQWASRFRNRVISQDVNAQDKVEASVEVLHEDRVLLSKKGIGPSGKKAYHYASKAILDDILAATNLTEVSGARFQEPYYTMTQQFIKQLISTRGAKRNRTAQVVDNLGGFGIEKFQAKQFRSAYKSLENTAESLGQFNVPGIEQLILKTYTNTDFIRSLKFNSLNINPLLKKLITWLEQLSIESSLDDLENLNKSIVDTLQVFRLVTEEKFGTISISSIFENIQLVRLRGIQIEINNATDTSLECYGQRPFLEWYFFSIISNMQNFLAKGASLNLKINLTEDKDTGHFNIEFLFDSINLSGGFYHDLRFLNQFASYSFMEVEAGRNHIIFKPMSLSIEKDDIPSHIFKWVHEKQLGSLYELRPIGSLIHDIKNALSIIKIKLKMLQKLERTDITELHRLGQACVKKVEHLSTYFKHNKTDLSQFFLDELIEQIEIETKTLAGENHTVQFESKLDEVEVLSDRDIIHSVVFNLAKNAIESLGDQGEIKITFELKKNQLAISVQDNGSGIPLEKQETLFTSFYSSKIASNGSGIGLPTVKRIVELLDGEISFESFPGKGTTFLVRIPM